MKKKIIILIISILLLSLSGIFFVKGIFWYKLNATAKAATQAREAAIDQLVESRKNSQTNNDTNDPFGEGNRLKILLIGVDKRVGQTQGHCDAIQLLDIDKEQEKIMITAVPRGTYSPLPPGKGATSSDYYVSNACGLGGLEYGVTQIEKILGQKADYLAVVGFSETLGILRTLKLPTTETLQWLRHRQGYAIGEPQRARNHSTFIKQMLTQFIPTKNSSFDTTLHVIIYKMIQTDLSFAQTQSIIDALSNMDLSKHPERITLSMRPAYTVQDIAYDPEHLDENIKKMLDPIKHLLSKDAYSGMDEEEIQKKLLAAIKEKKQDPNFISWAFDNDIWLQIEDDETRKKTQYEFLKNKLALLTKKEEREALIADYVLEMEYMGENWWADKAKVLLEKEIQ